jgi:hypothetical protein
MRSRLAAVLIPVGAPARVAAVLAAVIAGAALAGCGSSSPTTAASAGASASTGAPDAPGLTATESGELAPERAHRAKPVPAAGSLPQTTQLPSSHTSAFRTEMQALWRGIRLGSTGPALPAFFPEAAYSQVKAIADASADWTSRLVGEYSLDIGAAHALLGAGAGHDKLVGVDVPAGYAHWVPPGTCYNRVGYFETPNSRLVYVTGGQEHSFGIASMISWRGVWYVVHLGAVLRPGEGGVVDDPSPGAGTATPSSTC